MDLKEILCTNCLGCNLFEMPDFKGKYECKYFFKANEKGIDLCKKILKGEQLKI